jgi:5-methylcytosine-specific restriction endonuclease McrA
MTRNRERYNAWARAYRQKHSRRTEPPPISTKRCPSCPSDRGEQPISNFSKDRTTPIGYSYQCKTCAGQRRRQHFAETRAVQAERAKAWRQKHPERVKAKKKAEYIRNKARIQQRGKAYRAKNKEKLKQSMQAWYQSHLDHVKAYRKINRARDRAQENAHHRAHPELVAAKDAKRRMREQAAAMQRITRQQWDWLKAFYGQRCAYCGIKPKRLTMDHIIPLARGGTHTLENLIPACKSCNSRKNMKPAPVHQLSLLQLIDL